MNICQVLNLIKKTSVNQLINIKKFNKGTTNYARSYMASYCMCTLINIGFFDELKHKTRVKIAQFCLDRELNPKIMEAICNYLFILKILNKNGDEFSLEKKGDNLLRYCVAAFDFIYAYAPLFENLEALLKNEKKYDVDVFRRGRHVAKATAEVSQFIPLPVVESIIKEYNFKKVLDLGCGSAEFLIQICSKTDIYGLGVDISEDAVKYACEMIGKSKANGKVSVVVDDIFNFEMSKNEYRNVDLITSMFVMHEFLNTGKQTVINLLKRIKSNFPDTHLLICELAKSSPEELRAHPSSIAEHHIFHALSNQEITTVTDWREIFKISGYELLDETRFDFAGQAYFMLK